VAATARAFGTLPITWRLKNGGQSSCELAAWLADAAHTTTATEGELRQVAALIERGGGRLSGMNPRFPASELPRTMSKRSAARIRLNGSDLLAVNRQAVTRRSCPRAARWALSASC
jgi:hypothetical protein